MASFAEGYANNSKHHPDPPLHIVMPQGNELRTWCGGGLAASGNTVNRLRCKRCTALLREGVDEGNYDQAELDQWLASTRSTRQLGVGRR